MASMFFIWVDPCIPCKSAHEPAHFPLLFLQGLNHFDEILQEADGIILSRGNLGIDLPPEKVSFQ